MNQTNVKCIRRTCCFPLRTSSTGNEVVGKPRTCSADFSVALGLHLIHASVKINNQQLVFPDVSVFNKWQQPLQTLLMLSIKSRRRLMSWRNSDSWQTAPKWGLSLGFNEAKVSKCPWKLEPFFFYVSTLGILIPTAYIHTFEDVCMSKCVWNPQVNLDHWVHVHWIQISFLYVHIIQYLGNQSSSHMNGS